jgi:Zn-dependent peptidase ImmA (M78 family)
MQYNDINIKQIEKEANKFSKKYNKEEIPPIIAKNIVESENFKIGITKLHGSQVAVLNRNEKTIYLTENEALLKIWGNFALAHELGHWVLHKNAIDAFDPSTLFAKERSKDDREADCFASFLLIPDKLMRGWLWLEEPTFASAFKVPQEGVQIRKTLNRPVTK